MHQKMLQQQPKALTTSLRYWKLIVQRIEYRINKENKVKFNLI